MAALGIARALGPGRGRQPSVPLYLAMGWCGLAVGWPMVRGLPGLAWLGLLSGCLFYMAGIQFYRLGARLRHGHGIWHLFVLAGTTSHFFTVLRILG